MQTDIRIKQPSSVLTDSPRALNQGRGWGRDQNTHHHPQCPRGLSNLFRDFFLVVHEYSLREF